MNYRKIVSELREISILREHAEEETDHRETLEAYAADSIERLAESNRILSEILTEAREVIQCVYDFNYVPANQFRPGMGSKYWPKQGGSKQLGAILKGFLSATLSFEKDGTP